MFNLSLQRSNWGFGKKEHCILLKSDKNTFAFNKGLEAGSAALVFIRGKAASLNTDRQGLISCKGLL